MQESSPIFNQLISLAFERPLASIGWVILIVGLIVVVLAFISQIQAGSIEARTQNRRSLQQHILVGGILITIGIVIQVLAQKPIQPSGGQEDKFVLTGTIYRQCSSSVLESLSVPRPHVEVDGCGSTQNYFPRGYDDAQSWMACTEKPWTIALDKDLSVTWQRYSESTAPQIVGKNFRTNRDRTCVTPYLTIYLPNDANCAAWRNKGPVLVFDAKIQRTITKIGPATRFQDIPIRPGDEIPLSPLRATNEGSDCSLQIVFNIDVLKNGAKYLELSNEVRQTGAFSAEVRTDSLFVKMSKRD